MNGRLRVEGLSNIVLDAELRQLFQPHGTVINAQIIADPTTGLGSGAGLVEMGSDAEASTAILSLDGAEHLGRRFSVIPARDG
jgi:RNA recognition motif-containing protein